MSEPLVIGPLVIGVDLGGTQLRLAAVNPSGELATEVFVATTGVDVTTDDLTRELQWMWLQVQTALPTQTIRACGVGITGVIRQQRLAASDFLPHLVAHDVPALFSAALENIPVKIENDARCFLLAEARFGAGRGARNACGITLGTGAGGAVMVNGELITGTNAEAGEVWRIPCRDSFLEYFVSGAGLVRGYQAAGGVADETITAADVAARARAGERAALQAWKSYGNDVYALCETMIALLEPEVIILGGSMAQAHDLFGAQFKEKLAGRATRIALAELDAAAGLIGAAALHFG
jgi:glucokinase